ncbi:MAG: hypothetical protein AB1762_08145 [Gemmatimonadota bacterium]
MYRGAACVLLVAAELAAQPRVVSPVGDGAQVEPFIVGNPRNPNELVVANMLVQAIDPTNWRVQVFWTDDAGAGWREAQLPARDGAACSGDVWLAWGRERNVYLTCLATVTTSDGRDFNFKLWLHASRDAGRTWSAPIEVATQPVGEWDHPVLSLVPASAGSTRDTLFVTGTRPRRVGNGFGVARYAEGMPRFDAMRLYEPPERRNDSFGSAVALSSDRLLFTYFAMGDQPPRPLYSVLVTDTAMQRSSASPNVMPWGFPMLAQQGNHRDGSITAVWLEGADVEGLDVILGTSTDSGRTWVTSPVTSGLPRRVRARPNVVFDAVGNVAVTWFEAESFSPCGEVVLAVRNVGRSQFTERARVPTTDAACKLPGDSTLVAIVNRWRAGGDYSGIHSPAAGVFDIVWSDVRQDGFRVRYLRVRSP